MTPPPKDSKQPKDATASTSRDLVRVGPRHVSAKHLVGRRNEDGQKPTTARALVLRNGKQGAMGTGEMVLSNKISGREKLDLLVEDMMDKVKKENLMDKAKMAVRTPFNLDECHKISESQFNVYLDDICNLQESDTFFSTIQAEIKARFLPNNIKKSDPLRDQALVLKAFGSRIHNSFMLASAWRMIREYFLVFDEEFKLGNAVGDSGVRKHLRDNDELRTEYLVLYDIVKVLVDAAQAKFALLATTTPHYSQYFTSVNQTTEVGFDFANLKNVYKSFVDSIVIELCLPESAMPKFILTTILQEALEESPSEARRFPQALWDALGDLSVAIKLQEILEVPLQGLEGEQWLKQEREKPQEFDQWIYAQDVSAWVCDNFGDSLSMMFPLEKTRYQTVVTEIWTAINGAFQDVSGATPEELWLLEGQITRQSRWHALPPPRSEKEKSIIRPAKSARSAKKKPLAITDGNDSDGSMPSLETVSDSSEGDDESDSEEEEWDDEEEQWDEDEEDDDESGYDTDEEEELKNMLREVMNDAAAANPDFLDPTKEFDTSELEKDKKGNPFIKLLGSLRGRIFSSKPNLQTNPATAPRTKQFTPPAKPPGAAKPKASATKPSQPSKPPPTKTSEAQKNRNVTVEEVEDEEEETTTSKKKKKKKPKKKKKATSAAAEESVEAPAPETPPASPSPVASPKPTPTSPPQKKPTPAAKSPSAKPSNASTASLPSLADLSRQQSAQSSHSYLQSEKPAEPKSKIKSRPEFGNLLAITENSEKKSIFNWRGRNKEEPTGEKDNKQALHKWFSRMKKGTKEYMHQLLGSPEDDKKGQAGMKWENFLKVMREMGFEYDPSTAGSSVRFDPPNKKDKPITFHKPHPDSTIPPIMLKEFGKRLTRQYGWSELYFAKAS